MKDRRTGEYTLMDVHGAGSQRSDPKVGDASEFPHGRGPQGDVIRIENMVRCVRGGDVEKVDGASRSVPDAKEPAPPSRFMKHEDRNGDGKVSKDEFRGPDEHFGHLDKDGDGYISEEEAPIGPPPNRK